MESDAMFLSSSGVGASFITEWTVSASDSITLPLNSGFTYNFKVDYGDGSGEKIVTAFNDAEASHTYVSGGVYDVTITGSCPSFTVAGDSSIDTKITQVKQWGDIELVALNFHGCSNLTLLSVTDTPVFYPNTTLTKLFFGCTSITTINNLNSWDTSNVIDMSQVFNDCNSFNQDIPDWDVSSVANFSSMFQSATAFNGTLTGWATTAATDVTQMFNSADVFNQPVNHFDLNGCSSLYRMFYSANVFNQDLDLWDTSTITAMRETFRDAVAFNGDVSTWETGLVTDMIALFRNANAFNQNLNTSGAVWDVSNVSFFIGVFQDANSFNGTLTGWDTASATSMNSMFNNANAFAQSINHFDLLGVTSTNLMLANKNYDLPLNLWNTSTVENMTFMFANNLTFNQDITGWDTSSLTNMSNMFENAESFNQDIGGWDTSSVTNMIGPIFRTEVFDQDLSDWNIEAVTIITDFGRDANGFSVANYDLILEKWSLQSVNSNLSIRIDAGYTQSSVDSGTTDGTTANKLVDSTQNFITTVSIGDIIHNTTDDTYAEVTAIDSDTQLSLDNDIMVSGETYVVQSSLAAKGRYVLLNTYNWTITDDGAI